MGLLVSQSGVYASVGRDMQRGFQTFLDQHGGKLGGKTVNLVTVDEGSTPQSGVAGATRLVRQEQVDAVVGIVASPTAMGSRDIFNSAQVPVLMGNTGAVALGGAQASDWIWRASFDNRDPGRALGRRLAADASGGKVFLIASDYAGGHENLEGFKKTFPANRIAGELYPPFGTTSDYSSYLAQIRASGAKQVFAFFAGGEAIEFTKQFAAFGLSKHVRLNGTFLTDGASLAAEGNAALGVRSTAVYNWDRDNAVNKAFVKDYQQKFHALPSIPSGCMYDVGVILNKAVASISGRVDRASINDALRSIGTVQGARGKLRFDDHRTMVNQMSLIEAKKTADGIRNVTVRPLP
ncbi:ABC transporter substrate-binding protein [Streptomyces sp. NPDC059455]|uniref:ABC transporter substrate-binding protein n=1 Tax=Streptomyces sp. NPDC059455 TaxID=3346837 RepID=UPI00368AF3FE